MIVLVVSGGLVVVGCDAAYVKTTRLSPGPYRMQTDTIWARDSAGVFFLPMNRCDVREVLLLGYASDPSQPTRPVLELSPLVFRAGDINFDGIENAADLVAFINMPYDYNLDGRLDGTDYFDLISIVSDPMMCE